jgi:protein-disulfide isomerase
MFPLISIHASAQKSAEAAFCAGRQDKFWEMEEKLFATQEEWGSLEDAVPRFKQLAADLGLDTKAFDQCLDGGEATNDVNADSMAAQTFGVNSTPTFFVNDIQIPLTSTEAMFQVIDYVGATGALPEIMPQTEDFHVQGNLESAQTAMAAFLDYSSPDAAKYATEVYPQIAQQYIDAGSLIYIFHPWAGEEGSAGYQAAIAAECAGEQGKFQEMQQQLFKDQVTWTNAKTPRDNFAGYAKALGLDAAKFETCLDGDWAKQRARAGTVVGSMYGVAAAQTYLFGDGNSLNGAPAFEEFKTIIDGMLGQ